MLSYRHVGKSILLLNVQIFPFNGKTCIVRDIDRSVPQGRAGGSIYRMRMYDVVSGAKFDETFKDSDMLEMADLVRRPAMFSYIDGEEYVFLDKEDYTPYHLNKESIEKQILARLDINPDPKTKTSL